MTYVYRHGEFGGAGEASVNIARLLPVCRSSKSSVLFLHMAYSIVIQGTPTLVHHRFGFGTADYMKSTLDRNVPVLTDKEIYVL